jgi:hypothetical protein
MGGKRLKIGVWTDRDRRNARALWNKAGGPTRFLELLKEANRASPRRGQPPIDDFECLSIDDEPDGYRIVTFRLGGKVRLAIVRPRRKQSRPGLYRTTFETLREVATNGDADAAARRWLQRVNKRAAKK